MIKFIRKKFVLEILFDSGGKYLVCNKKSMHLSNAQYINVVSDICIDLKKYNISVK